MAGKFLRGAFVEFMPTFLIPLPNVIIFQYRTRRRFRTPGPLRGAPAPGAAASTNPLAVNGRPTESFSSRFLAMDAGDTIADGSAVAPRSPHERHLQHAWPRSRCYSVPNRIGRRRFAGLGLDFAAAGGLSVGGSAGARRQPYRFLRVAIPDRTVDVGPGRTVCRSSDQTLTITEKLYDHPAESDHAEAQLGAARAHAGRELQQRQCGQRCAFEPRRPSRTPTRSASGGRAPSPTSDAAESTIDCVSL